MSTFVQRKHVIGVRLSGSEYKAMNQYCLEHELSSMADLARKAIAVYIAPETTGKARDQHVSDLERQVEELRNEMASLSVARQNENQDSGEGGVEQ